MDDVVPPGKLHIISIRDRKILRIHLELKTTHLNRGRLSNRWEKKPNIFPDVGCYIMLHPMKIMNLIAIWLFNIAMERSTIFKFGKPPING